MRENFELELSDVFQSEGKEVKKQLSYTPKEVILGGASYEIEADSEVVLRLQNTAQGKAYLEGSFTAYLTMPCDRCLKNTKQKVVLSFERELLSGELRKENEDAEESFLSGDTLDVYALIDEELLLNLPSKVLCRPDCKGLCPVCGRDLNEGECGCDMFVPDPRLAGLNDILKEMSKEV